MLLLPCLIRSMCRLVTLLPCSSANCNRSFSFSVCTILFGGRGRFGVAAFAGLVQALAGSVRLLRDHQRQLRGRVRTLTMSVALLVVSLTVLVVLLGLGVCLRFAWLGRHIPAYSVKKSGLRLVVCRVGGR